MELRQIALEVARILQDAGKHALNDQMNPHDMRKLEVSEDCFHFTSDTDKRLQQFISNRLTYVNVFDGLLGSFAPNSAIPASDTGVWVASTA